MDRGLSLTKTQLKVSEFFLERSVTLRLVECGPVRLNQSTTFRHFIHQATLTLFNLGAALISSLRASPSASWTTLLGEFNILENTLNTKGQVERRAQRSGICVSWLWISRVYLIVPSTNIATSQISTLHHFRLHLLKLSASILLATPDAHHLVKISSWGTRCASISHNPTNRALRLIASGLAATWFLTCLCVQIYHVARTDALNFSFLLPPIFLLFFNCFFRRLSFIFLFKPLGNILINLLLIHLWETAKNILLNLVQMVREPWNRAFILKLC